MGFLFVAVYIKIFQQGKGRIRIAGIGKGLYDVVYLQDRLIKLYFDAQTQVFFNPDKVWG